MKDEVKNLPVRRANPSDKLWNIYFYPPHVHMRVATDSGAGFFLAQAPFFPFTQPPQLGRILRFINL